ncbi:hypothetical protein [Desulfovibrio sp.]|uniref:hypothetical protein n=1 Tax=Desulfovibrio sp. TaxID=885 RepID=UPI0025B9A523|nr:hypothetical protein [Desulfovibrio sp.]
MGTPKGIARPALLLKKFLRRPKQTHFLLRPHAARAYVLYTKRFLGRKDKILFRDSAQVEYCSRKRNGLQVRYAPEAFRVFSGELPEGCELGG